MIKPVWRLNKGEGVPSDLGAYVVYVGDNGKLPTVKNESDYLWLLGKHPNEIYAYQTTRTRKAKRVSK